MQSFFLTRTARYIGAGVVAACALTVAPVGAQRPFQDGGPGGFPGPRVRKPLSAEEQAQLRDRLKTLTGAEKRGWETLLRMMRADKKQAYAAREVRLSANGQEREFSIRCDPKRGIRFDDQRPKGKITLDDFQKTYEFNPKNRAWTMRDSTQARARTMSDDLIRRLLKGNLRVTLEGQDTVAGRPADIVRVEPSGGGGPRFATARRFWVDRATGLRMKHEVIRPDERLASSSYFVSVDFSPHFRSEDFAPPANATPVKDQDGRQKFTTLEEARQAGIDVRTPTNLPKGFTLRVVEVWRPPDRGPESGMVTVRYGNGLSVISLTRFPGDAPLPVDCQLTGPNRSGFLPPPQGMDGRAYTWLDGGYRYFLLGTLAEAEMQRIAQSLH